MEPKVRVVEGPLPTDVEGARVAGGIGWYPWSVGDARVYVPSLTNGTRPVPAHGVRGSREALMAVAKRIIQKDDAIFRALA
jgi:hypothetical protein